ncbi:MAG: phosphate signaling complex protein PhoU [Thermodesulfobacteriota bacterium]
MALHTDRRYEEELAHLRKLILEMGGLVERQIGDAISSLAAADRELAERTIERDHEVNRYDVDIDEECLRLLALHQPAARDLRLITTSLKITTDLERIGDMAVNVCERAIELSETPSQLQVDLPRMADTVRKMLRESLDAFVREDAELALSVCKEDDGIDAMHAQMFADLLGRMTRDPSLVVAGTAQLFVSKYLERIADHATNIAEMVIFMVKGKSIRHLSVPASI